MAVEETNPYLQAAEKLLAESGCTVRRWRPSNGGRAYTKADDWGIDVPCPTGPVSFGVFCHEVAHQMLHREGSRPRWQEEVEAEAYALDQFSRFGVRGQDTYRRRAVQHMAWAFYKALRRTKNPAVLAARIRETFPNWWDEARRIELLERALEKVA